ncbi:prepilin-type N-terminal cleavage/methylation domain-containing protein [Deinococcus pimensis]|uniref:prepilin-type N-terminal cleavage/methylation domain-containing protein n=1 Tax=Deinococcus pimensis TaxID=309888 RepID=UPI000486C225|nr:prepilin-type N-terminal cleavage/methylation domain-containing protein [Deinococcus pimensis]
MRRTREGLTLTELLIAMLVVGVILVAIQSLLSTAQKTTVTMQQTTDVTQNAEVAGLMLQNDLISAGFTGGPGAFTDALVAATSIVPTGARSNYLAQSALWEFVDTSGKALNTLVVTSPTCTAGTVCPDTLALTRVKAISTVSYTLERVEYTAATDSGGTSLTRKVTTYACPASGGGTFLYPTLSGCTATVGTAAAVVDGVEDFQVFFRNSGGAVSGSYSTTPFTGAVRDNKTASVGVYLRVRATRPARTFTDTATYPQAALPDGQTATALGIPTYTPTSTTDQSYRRTEKVLVVGLLNPQSVK